MIPEGPAFHKPKSFVAAKNIIYASIVIGILGVILRDYNLGISGNGGIPALVTTTLSYLVIIILVKQMALCKKWPRIVLIVLFASMIIVIPWLFKQESKAGTLDITLYIFQNVLQVIAVIFLFRRECNDWFDKGEG
jgi:hypothetical protein